jgi:carboxypeptidase PM20D1
MQGRAAFKVIVDTNGGHASMPPTDGSHTPHVMARVIAAMGKTPPPLFMQPPMTDMMRAAAPYAPFLLRGLLANADVWPIGQVLKHVWASMGPAANALVRSTAAPTMVNMGVAHNVIPAHAEAIVDMRLLQGQAGEVPRRYMQARAAEAAVRGARVTIESMEDSGGGIPDMQPSEVCAF